MNLLCNVFYDPSSPWYYVIGVIFLVLIFGALALYVVLSKKYGTKAGGEAKSEADDNNGGNGTSSIDEAAHPSENNEIDASEQTVDSSEPNNGNDESTDK